MGLGQVWDPEKKTKEGLARWQTILSKPNKELYQRRKREVVYPSFFVFIDASNMYFVVP